MSLTVHQFACLTDNYGYLVQDTASGQTATIDTPDARAVLAALAETGWTLSLILNTHWHPDHAGGNAEVQAATGAQIAGPAEVRRIAPLDRELQGGDQVVLGETAFSVIDCGGHTLGHIAYFDATSGKVFVGDTLFTLGCGRLFEGTASQMWSSLQRLARLPPTTTVYCAHEYTAANAKFALSVDNGPALRTRTETLLAARARGEWTVPTTISEELATNPFLRAPLLVQTPGLTDAEAFAELRTAKDRFQG